MYYSDPSRFDDELFDDATARRNTILKYAIGVLGVLIAAGLVFLAQERLRQAGYYPDSADAVPAASVDTEGPTVPAAEPPLRDSYEKERGDPPQRSDAERALPDKDSKLNKFGEPRRVNYKGERTWAVVVSIVTTKTYYGRHELYPQHTPSYPGSDESLFIGRFRGKGKFISESEFRGNGYFETDIE